MANNYLQSSCTIPNLTEKEAAWLRRILEALDEREDIDAREERWLLKELGPEAIRHCENAGNLGFSFEPKELWLSGEEFFNVNLAIEVMQKFLQKFRPDSWLSFTYSETCSSMRVGEFGGGGMFVTAEKVEWINASLWIRERQKAFEVKKRTRKAKR